MKKGLQTLGLIFILSLIGHLGCGDDPVSSNGNIGSIKISIKSINSNPSSLAKIASNTTSAFVTITSAKLVIEKIRFESTVHDTLDFRFRQPFVQDLILGSDINVIETIQIPFGSYKESEIEIDDLDPEDGVVYTENPELQKRSVLIKGFMNGDSTEIFIFASEFSEEQKREFNPPLVLDENTPSTNVVLVINMDSWFIDSNGNLLDPRSSNNDNMIEDNIKDSIEIFEDEDDDGERDD